MENPVEVQDKSEPSVIEKAATGRKLNAAEETEATQWFLEAEQEAVAHKSFQVNVAAVGERWITWTVQAIDRDKIGQFRRQSSRGSRAQRRGGMAEFDDAEMNLKIVAEGTVDPNLRDPKIRGQFADPSQALKARFAHKPGLIDQIAGEVIDVSGFDDEDVRDVEVTAAKNS